MDERKEGRRGREREKKKDICTGSRGRSSRIFFNEVRAVLRKMKGANKTLPRDTAARGGWRQGIHDGAVCSLRGSGPSPARWERQVQAATLPETGTWRGLRAQVAPGSPLPCSLRPLPLPCRKLKHRDSDWDMRESSQGDSESPV